MTFFSTRSPLHLLIQPKPQTTTQKQIVLVLLLNVKSRLQDQRLGHGMRTLKGSLGKHNKAWCCAPLVIGHPLEWIRYYANGIWDTSTTRTRWTDITSTLGSSLVLYPNKMRHFPGTCSNFRDSKQEASDKCGRKRTIRWSVITSHRSPLLDGDAEDWGKDRDHHYHQWGATTIKWIRQLLRIKSFHPHLCKNTAPLYSGNFNRAVSCFTVHFLFFLALFKRAEDCKFNTIW